MLGNKQANEILSVISAVILASFLLAFVFGGDPETNFWKLIPFAFASTSPPALLYVLWKWLKG